MNSDVSGVDFIIVGQAHVNVWASNSERVNSLICDCSDLSSVTSLKQVILNSFSPPSEEVKSAASYTLGSVAVGNLPQYLPFVLQEIEAQPKRQYLLLHSLKEVGEMGNVNVAKGYDGCKLLLSLLLQKILKKIQNNTFASCFVCVWKNGCLLAEHKLHDSVFGLLPLSQFLKPVVLCHAAIKEEV